MSTMGHESEAINVQGLKASLQKLKTNHIDAEATARANAVSAETTRAQAAEASLSSGKADKSTTLAGYGITDAYTKSETYTKTEVNGLVDTPHQDYVTVATYASLPASGSKDTIYRVSNYNGSTNQVDVTSYSEYAWNGSQYIFLCVKSQIGEVFDISVYNNNTKYADLAAALNGGANIPQSLQKGGMSIKFVLTDDNKYVQYRSLLSGSFTTSQFINPANWEKVVSIKDFLKYNGIIDKMRYDNTTSSFVFDDTTFLTPLIVIPSGVTSIKWTYAAKTDVHLIVLDEQFNIIGDSAQNSGISRTITLPQDSAYVRAGFDWDVHSDSIKWSVSYGDDIILWSEDSLFMKVDNIDNGINPFSNKVTRSIDVYNKVFSLAGLIPCVKISTNPSTLKLFYEYDEQGFLTELIPLNGATSIRWQYHESSGIRLGFYDANKNFVDAYGQVSGSYRDITTPANAVFVRGAFDWRKHSISKDWNITDNNDNLLWSEEMLTSEMYEAIKNLQSNVGEDKFQLKLFNTPSAQNPTLNSKRLNHDGSIVTWSGGVFKTSRFIPVGVGDVVTFSGVGTEYSSPLIGFSDANFGTEYFVADLIPANTYTSGIPFKRSITITNAAIKFVASCGYVNNGEFEFNVGFSPATKTVEDIITLSSLRNYYPNAMSKAGGFVQKYLNGDDVNIMLLGDSITAVANQKLNTDLDKIPCFMEHQNWCYWLWKYLNKSQNIIHRRYDYPNFFTFTGDFTETSENSLEPYNYTSSDSNPSFEFEWNLSDYEKTNILIPRNGRQCYNGIKIEVLSNNVATDNLVEYYNGSSWVEANETILDLRLTVDTNPSGMNISRNLRHKFRRKVSSGNISIKVSKNSTDGELQMWGVEQWNGQGIFIINAAFGGAATYELAQGISEKITHHLPDLVLFELTLVNNFGDRMGESNSKELMYNDFYDFIWGDRTGTTPSGLSLKELSNNWNDWQVILIVPHWRHQWVEGNEFKMTIENTPVKYSALDCYNVVLGLIKAKGDLEYLNLGAEMKREAFQRSLTLEQSYNGVTDQTMDSTDCFTQDTVHLNNLGSKIYGKYIAPIFDM